MVKFGKHLEMEAVPEWRAAYCSYKQLKKALKKIKFEGELQRSRSAREGATGGLVRRLSLDSIARSRRRGNPKDFIRVHRRRMLDGAQVCETKLLQGAEPMVTPLERNFFAKLDEQLNKVDDFYRKKEAEFVERSEMLDKQMEALQEMQTILDHANSKANGDRNSDSESKQEEGSPAHDGALSPRPEADPSPRKTSKQSEDVIQIKTDSEGFSPNGSLSSPLQQMRFSLPPMGARAVISSLSQNFWDDLRQQLNLSASDSKQPHQSTVVSRKKVQYAAKMLRNAYIEFYRGLTLLKSYSSLNIVAFGKILKKYDKVTGRRASAIYLEAVEESAVHTSDKIAKLMERVELKFTAEFTQGDRRSAMRSLRPLPQKDSHVVTFFLGVFTGSITALLAGVGIALHMGGVHWKPTPQNPSYKESEPIFQVFSMLTLIALHMYLYGWNVYLWKKAHINYGFIFEFAPGKELQYREVLLLASGFATFIMGALVAHLALHISVHEKGSERPGAYIDVIPFVVVLVSLLLLFLPNNICYYSSRKFFLRCLLHLSLAPLYKVVFADFFLGDQLTSQVQMLRNLEYFACYYMGGFFSHHDTQTCLGNKHYRNLAYMVSSLPYFFSPHAVCVRVSYARYYTTGWLVITILTSFIATVYGLYWDLVVDWGLLQPRSKNPWLRDELMLRNKSIYFICMASNTLLRLAWILSLNHLHFSNMVNRHFQDLLVGVLEVVRRGQWNFFRLENEHLNNVGKYRAVKTVPLPFREVVAADEGEV